MEKTILQLQDAMAAGMVTSRELVEQKPGAAIHRLFSGTDTASPITVTQSTSIAQVWLKENCLCECSVQTKALFRTSTRSS
jgi:predicted transcriptional regulator